MARSQFFPLRPRLKWTFAVLSGLLLLFWILPVARFTTDYATVLTDRNQHLLGAHIAGDEQWRFPPGDSVPDKFRQAILLFEDEYFYYHPGVNPVSLLRAGWSNLQKRRIVSGGSTLTMQVVRLARPSPRNLLHKTKEMVLALRLEAALSKDSILAVYAAHAPFGGNTVGLEAAAWRYFNHPPHHLTWAETALLAVLPNAPALMHPGRSRDQLLQKRNTLLHKLHARGHLSDLELQLALLEPLPDAPRPMPQLAPHLLDRQIVHNRGVLRQLTIDADLQRLAAQVVERHSRRLQGNEIYNAAAIIASVETGEVLAYVGNSNGNHRDKGFQVDIIRSHRSSGSVLKPFLYAFALNDGLILPTTLLPDIPTYYRGFTPQNYQRQFDGAVPADQALSRSLNIPFVRLLNDYDGSRFIKNLHQSGFTTIQKPYAHYGLSLILGGCETTLWDLAGSYASLGRTLQHYANENSRYRLGDFMPLQLEKSETGKRPDLLLSYPTVLSAASIYFTLKAMSGVQRPPEESGWEHFSSSRQIAWKTGTSYGFRDAWGVGVTPEYVIAVWAGNASGEGRPGIVGGLAAGPILFELFGLLPSSSAFPIPYDDLLQIPVCTQSGHRAGPHCTPADSLFIPVTTKKTTPCPYHELVHLTANGQYRTSMDQEVAGTIRSESFFILPPVMQWYYRRFHPEYRALPPYKPGSENPTEGQPMDLIYPPNNTTVFVPRNLDGQRSRIVISAVHRQENMAIHWHLNGQYLGRTYQTHEMEILPNAGRNTLTLIDEAGQRLIRNFLAADDHNSEH